MLTSTLPRLSCPAKRTRCAGELVAHAAVERPGAASGVTEIVSGHLECRKCHAHYPILMGVAVVVADVRRYLIEHAKGISQRVPDEQIPKEHRTSYQRALRELAVEAYESDLESERVNALYVMNHYLTAKLSANPWWKSQEGEGSPALEKIVRDNWDHGPLATIAEELPEQVGAQRISLVELGCGVGGLGAVLRTRAGSPVSSYLGVDSAFASIALARHFVLGAPLEGAVLLPEDLLAGPVSRPYAIRAKRVSLDGSCDFVVGDAEAPPLKPAVWDATASLNMIDMLPEPALLPRLQASLLKPGGLAIQSGPYLWHAEAAERLRDELPAEVHDSAGATEWLYEREGFEISKSHRHIPWVFFKHLRQVEVYSVHLFFARLRGVTRKRRR